MVSRDSLPLKWGRSQRKVTVKTGLVNFGVTCYMNSLLQCLAWVPPFARYLTECNHQEVCVVDGFCVMCEMQRIVAMLGSGVKRAFKPKRLHKNLRQIGRVFHRYRQEDSHELLRFLIDKLGDVDIVQAEARTGKRPTGPAIETTAMHAIFGGHLQSTVVCPHCSRVSVTKEPFLDLSVNISRARNVEAALDDFTSTEVLDRYNMYYCVRCQGDVQAEKTLQLLTTPPSLVIHLKRFRGSRKLPHHVDFPLDLDLAPYMTQLPPVPPSELPRYTSYTLTGLVVHHGHSPSSGHYVAYVRSPSGSWACANDSFVSPVTVREVLSQQAYLLFYSASQPEVLAKTEIDKVMVSVARARAREDARAVAAAKAKRAAAKAKAKEEAAKRKQKQHLQVQQFQMPKRKMSKAERRREKKRRKKLLAAKEDFQALESDVAPMKWDGHRTRTDMEGEHGGGGSGQSRMEERASWKDRVRMTDAAKRRALKQSKGALEWQHQLESWGEDDPNADRVKEFNRLQLQAERDNVKARRRNKMDALYDKGRERKVKSGMVSTAVPGVWNTNPFQKKAEEHNARRKVRSDRPAGSQKRRKVNARNNAGNQQSRKHQSHRRARRMRSKFGQ